MATQQILDLNKRLDSLVAATEGKHINEISRADLEEVARLRGELASAWQLQYAYKVEELSDLHDKIEGNADDFERESMFEEQYENEQFAQDNDYCDFNAAEGYDDF